MAIQQNVFNLTKVGYVDIQNDLPGGIEDPKIKGYFVCLMVKPDLNIMHPSNFASKYYSAGKGNENEYSEKTMQAKYLKGLINETVWQNLVHGQFALQISDIVANKCESVSYPDIGNTSEDTSLSLDKASFKLPVGETGTNGMTFSMRFRENEALDCLRMMSAWHRYIQGVTKGTMRPKSEYISNKVIDYKASLYVLHLKPDFKTITMFSKYTGIYPNNIPLSAFSEEVSQVQDVTFDVEFSYDKFEWLNEDILKEINLLFEMQFNFANSKTVEAFKFTNAPLIRRINDSPFYYVDFNGLKDRLGSKTAISFDELPQRKLGLSFTEIDEHGRPNAYFPAPLNSMMVDVNTKYSLSGVPTRAVPKRNRGNNKPDPEPTFLDDAIEIGREWVTNGKKTANYAWNYGNPNFITNGLGNIVGGVTSGLETAVDGLDSFNNLFGKK